MSDLYALRDELSKAASAIALVNDNFAAGVAKSDEAVARLRSRVNELEAERGSMSLRIQHLEEQTEQLRKVVQGSQPVLNSAIKARDAARRKLRLLREVVHDLLDERRTGVPADIGVEGSEPEQEQDEGDSLSSSSDSESGDETTLTPKVESSIGEDVENDTGKAACRTPDEPTDCRHESIARALAEVAQAAENRVKWHIEFKKPPATAPRGIGPFTNEDLIEKLAFSEEVIIQLETMELIQEPAMQLHIQGNIAFLSAPLILQGPETFLISWGSNIVTANIKKYITTGTGRPMDSVFHLVVKPFRREFWYYLGAHKLQVVDLPSVWHTDLGEQERHELTTELSKRWTWHGAPSFTETMHLIETGRLEQCTIKLENCGLHEQSDAFAKQHLQIR